ncbi:MarR family transcriptional regulator [Streptosporangiaceae bacterium NEAU-GS5]|nr:MarR family transcriptional regulator [Streptosporangiaceae bacterium NEAU-GS5]
MADDDERLARDLRLAIGRVARRLRQLYADSGDQLPFLQLAVLQRLDRSGPASPGALAAAEAVSSPAIATAIAGLLSGGLVERDSDLGDRRRAIVTISSAGRNALRAREVANIARVHAALAGLTDDERRRLTEAVPALERMAGLL